MTLLQSRVEAVNAMAALGELPDVEISERGVKVSPLDNCVPVQVSPLAELVYSMLPRQRTDAADGSYLAVEYRLYGKSGRCPEA